MESVNRLNTPHLPMPVSPGARPAPSGARSASLGATPASPGATPNPHATPAAVGKQFESIFTSLLIKQMRQTVDGETMFGKDAGEVIGGMFDHYLGEHLAKAGSLGIGQMIRTQLLRRTVRP